MKAKQARLNHNLTHAIKTAHAACCLAGPAAYLDDIRGELQNCGVFQAVRCHDTAALFNWLIDNLSFQGISDSVASSYMTAYGNVRWSEIVDRLERSPSCPKLAGYWTFYNCRYEKSSLTCSEMDHIKRCPLPHHPLRNGRLNQTAYSLFFFMRDVVDLDFVSWIDRQIVISNGHDLDHAREAIIGPLRNVFGVADKVLAMTISHLLMGASLKPRWLEVGATFIAIDTLVHNFLWRTGILKRFGAEHVYGPGCYQAGGCESILRLIAANIDAREFNPLFPANFPRFVQSAIWRYCAEGGLGVCNGNRIDDNARCDKPNLPKNWQEIGVGDLVLAQETREDGWFEAICTDVSGTW